MKRVKNHNKKERATKKRKRKSEKMNKVISLNKEEKEKNEEGYYFLNNILNNVSETINQRKELYQENKNKKIVIDNNKKAINTCFYTNSIMESIENEFLSHQENFIKPKSKKHPIHTMVEYTFGEEEKEKELTPEEKKKLSDLLKIDI